MTVTNTTAKTAQLAADGVKVAFDFDFRVFADSDLLVYNIAADGTPTLKTISTDYTVARDSDGEGGTVTFTAPPANLTFVQIIRNVPYTQPTDIPVQGPLPEGPLENAIDRSVTLNQQIKDQLDLTIRLPQTTTYTGSLEAPNPVANNYLGMNAANTALEWKTSVLDGGVSIPALVAGQFLKANAGATALEFSTVTPPTASNGIQLVGNDYSLEFVSSLPNLSSLDDFDEIAVADNSDPNDAVKRVDTLTFKNYFFTPNTTITGLTITAGGSLTQAHGGSAIPRLIVPYLICTTIDAGYAVNDHVLYESAYQYGTGNDMISFVVDATNINIRFGSSSGVLTLPNKGTGVATAITPASWSLNFKVWY